MMPDLMTAVTWLAILAFALVAGTFFAFSSFIMGALGRLPPADGIAAMQSINVVVINPVFMTAFLGGGLIAAALAILSLGSLDQASGRFLLAGALIYLVGSIGVTMACNVPLNNALAAAHPADPGAAALWDNYLQRWTFWNHVRCAAAAVAMLACVEGLRA